MTARKKRGPGRPPLNASGRPPKPILVRLSDVEKKAFDAVAPAGRRAAFVRDVIMAYVGDSQVRAVVDAWVESRRG